MGVYIYLIINNFILWHVVCITDNCLFGEAGNCQQTGRVTLMWSEDEPPGLLAILGPPGLVAVSAILMHYLPSEVLMFLTVWTLASFPIGVLIGHCALGEEE
jgi:hypothetical protein